MVTEEQKGNLTGEVVWFGQGTPHHVRSGITPHPKRQEQCLGGRTIYSPDGTIGLFVHILHSLPLLGNQTQKKSVSLTTAGAGLLGGERRSEQSNDN